MSKYDWSGVGYEFKFLATEMVGNNYVTWGFKLEPTKTDSLWLDNESRVKPKIIGVNIFKGDWRDSLEKRPGEENAI